jgi:flavin-dependent dehydrogenase
MNPNELSKEKIIDNEIIYDVIIVGAGLSGSYAAYLLKKRCPELKILVIEAKNRVGGK